MKAVIHLVVLSLPLMASALFAESPQAAPSESQFMSTVQFVVQEPSPQLVERSKRLVKEQFANSVEVIRELHNHPYDVRTVGNEVVFYLVTDQDMRLPMAVAMSGLVQNLNGRVRTRGRSSFFRTTLAQPMGGYLETVVNDNHSGVVSIVAQSVPVRDLLKQLRMQLGNLSYLMPGECADRRVSWAFGKTQENTPKSIDTVMGELASFFHLKVEKKNETHIFSGDCTPEPPPAAQAMALAELSAPQFIPLNGITPSIRQVYFPVAPMGGE